MLPIKPVVRRRTRAAANTPTLDLASEAIATIGACPKLHLEYLPIDQLRQPNRKLRRYSKRQMHALKASLANFDFVRPILIDKDGVIIAGVAVWLAAKELKYETIPVIRIEHLTPEQIRLYRIGDNKLQMGEFIADELRLEFLELSDLSISLNLDLESTGHTTKEVDDYTLRSPPCSGDGNADSPEDDEGLEPTSGETVTRLGDVWIIDGQHKVICGNSLENETYAALMGEELAQMVVGDGPYNVVIKGNVSSRKAAQEFAFASGEMSCEEFIAFQRQAFRHMADFSIDGSIHYAFISWHFVCELLTAGRAEYDELKNLLVWSKCQRRDKNGPGTGLKWGQLV